MLWIKQFTSINFTPIPKIDEQVIHINFISSVLFQACVKPLPKKFNFFFNRYMVYLWERPIMHISLFHKYWLIKYLVLSMHVETLLQNMMLLHPKSHTGSDKDHKVECLMTHQYHEAFTQVPIPKWRVGIYQRHLFNRNHLHGLD